MVSRPVRFSLVVNKKLICPGRELQPPPTAGCYGTIGQAMDPSRKRAIRLTIALTVALLLASALVYTSFAAGRDEFTASQLLKRAQPGQSYILAGTVLNGSVQQMSVPVRYTGPIPDPFAAGRAVLVTVREGSNSPTFVGQPNSLTTKCPSKYVAASGSY